MIKKILFIINPIAGRRAKDDLPELIHQTIDTQKFDVHIQFSEYAGHARELARRAAKKYAVVVAVGGDGTVNEIGSQLVHTNAVLGIVPLGSGNGLACKLDIPTLKPQAAIKQLNRFRVQPIDVGVLNGSYFLSNGGAGFEALVSNAFNQAKERGLQEYVQLIAKNYFAYQAKEYEIALDDGQIFREKAILLNFANSGIYGSGMGFSHRSQVNDGVLEMILVKDFARWRMAYMAPLFLSKKIHWSSFIKIISMKSAKIRIKQNTWIQIDGDALTQTRSLAVHLEKDALRVLV